MRKRRNATLPWLLSDEDLALLRGEPCWYCGGPLPSSRPGLDRFDELIGYRLDNVAPCCWFCNTTRSSGCYRPDEFRRIIAIYRERNGTFAWPGFRSGYRQRWHPDSWPLRRTLHGIGREVVDAAELRVRSLLRFQPALRRDPAALIRAVQANADLAERYGRLWRELGEDPWWQAWLSAPE